MPRASFTCPRCNRTSHNPNDAAEGYCAWCHDWTGPQRRVEDPFNRDEHQSAPGIRNGTALDTEGVRQLTFVGTDSTAIHSRSKGWLPAVMLTIDSVSLIDPDDTETSQRLRLMLTQADVELLAHHLAEAWTAAQADARYGLREP